MTNNQDKINQLLEKLERLLVQQDTFSREIDELREQIKTVQQESREHVKPETEDKTEKYPQAKAEPEEVVDQKKEKTPQEREVSKDQAQSKEERNKEDSIEDLEPLLHREKDDLDKKSNIEKFIGENLISKIGIAILIIGVAIGAKYSIENNLISPILRIILGYIAGIGLLGFGIKLKKKYHDFSAVLVAGSMAIMYFITFAAFDFYGLLPKLLTFAILVLFTIFTVFASMRYNRVVIAHIGLVGAYAVPFLLSDGTGSATALFSYVSIINVGILVIAIYKYWKSLYYSSFGLTWLLYFLWFEISYEAEHHFTPAFTFLGIFFLIFYSIFLVYKLRKKEEFEAGDVISLTANSFIFYAQGYFLLDNHPTGQDLLGLFTVITAVIHFVVSIILFRQKNADRNMFYLVVGLVMVFITMAVPIQLDGNWVTLIWTGEAGLLFWIGRTKNVPSYERLSYPLMLLGLASMGHDWFTLYNSYNPTIEGSWIPPVTNVNFLTSVIFIAIFGFIRYVESSKPLKVKSDVQQQIKQVLHFAIPSILLSSIYIALFMEISNYWDQLYTASIVEPNADDNIFGEIYRNKDLMRYKMIWLIDFSLIYVTIINFLTIKRYRNEVLASIGLSFSFIVLFIFFIQGLLLMSELRESYITQPHGKFYDYDSMNIWIRYISFVFVGGLIFSIRKLIKQNFLSIDLKLGFEFLLHTSILWIISSEFISWMDLSGSDKTYKLGLSILWGLYSLFLIIIGLWKKKKHLRIGAISLFGVTLIKLFVYDISHLNTIAKTIVFVSLGILLLIISFLYNKYKNIITDEEE